MRILLDTHILLWAAAGALPADAARYVMDMQNALFFSPASIWEVVIKQGLGRADFSADPVSLYNGLLGAGYQELPITSKHTLLIGVLPELHKDPFDRILLAQSASEGLSLLTSDKTLAQYPGAVILVSA
ncbi:MAG: type II toxin-antitoxin system VapC family toxin [Oscillospiraceae bacterium]|jgi:PIN domain nuclease of toxin-antitoxin system|nr:type II toxin-antitoxin system VapC family toxin [Oscillospiraceae bacterium]